MTTTTLTSIVLRFAGLLLFMKIFDHFGSYFISVYLAASFAKYDPQLEESISLFYFNGTYLVITNIVISSFLLFKADWLAKILVKRDETINLNFTPDNLIRVILLTTGTVWLATSIYQLPDLLSYGNQFILKLQGNPDIELPDFSLAKFILRTLIAVGFILGIDKISSYLENKVRSTTVQQHL
jgi:hypothetical protein